MSKHFYFKQFSLAKVHSLVLFDPDRNVSGVTTTGQSGPGSDGSDGVLCIPQSSSITGTSPSDFFSVICRTLVGSVTPWREAVGVFYSHPHTNWTRVERSSLLQIKDVKSLSFKFTSSTYAYYICCKMGVIKNKELIVGFLKLTRSTYTFYMYCMMVIIKN